MGKDRTIQNNMSTKNTNSKSTALPLVTISRVTTNHVESPLCDIPVTSDEPNCFIASQHVSTNSVVSLNQFNNGFKTDAVKKSAKIFSSKEFVKLYRPSSLFVKEYDNSSCVLSSLLGKDQAQDISSPPRDEERQHADFSSKDNVSSVVSKATRIIQKKGYTSFNGHQHNCVTSDSHCQTNSEQCTQYFSREPIIRFRIYDEKCEFFILNKKNEYLQTSCVTDNYYCTTQTERLKILNNCATQTEEVARLNNRGIQTELVASLSNHGIQTQLVTSSNNRCIQTKLLPSLTHCGTQTELVTSSNHCYTQTERVDILNHRCTQTELVASLNHCLTQTESVFKETDCNKETNGSNVCCTKTTKETFTTVEFNHSVIKIIPDLLGPVENNQEVLETTENQSDLPGPVEIKQQLQKTEVIVPDLKGLVVRNQNVLKTTEKRPTLPGLLNSKQELTKTEDLPGSVKNIGIVTHVPGPVESTQRVMKTDKMIPGSEESNPYLIIATGKSDLSDPVESKQVEKNAIVTSVVRDIAIKRLSRPAKSIIKQTNISKISMDTYIPNTDSLSEHRCCLDRNLYSQCHNQRQQIKTTSLETIAKRYGLVVHRIPEDGNCMFLAVVDQLRICGNFMFTKDILRTKALEYLRDHPNQKDGSHLASFLFDESWEEYLWRMNRDGEWGDHMILNGITEVTGRNITVLSTSGVVTHLYPHHQTVSNDQPLDTLYLGHIPEKHYDSLRPQNWEEIWWINALIHRMQQSLAINYSDESANIGESEHTNLNIKPDIGTESVPSDDMLKMRDLFVQYPAPCNNSKFVYCIDRDIHYIDQFSRIPVLLLSYIFRWVLPIDFFVKYNRGPLYFSHRCDIETIQIGSSSEGMNVRLLNLRKPRCQEITYSRQSNISKNILFPPSSVYCIVKYECEMSTPLLCTDPLKYLIDTDETHFGYLRLKTSVTCCCRFIRGYTNFKKVRGQWFVCRIPIQVSVTDPKFYKYVTGLKCTIWPDQAHEWVTRERLVRWPREEVIDNILKMGCYIVKQHHANSFDKDIEFQFLFSEAEKLLIKEEMTEDMKYCFYVFKAMVEYQTKDQTCKLPTYLLKTALLYACESISSDIWRYNCGGCVLYMIDLLLNWFRSHNLPNYFIKNNNMIEHWNPKDVHIVYERIEALRLFPCMVLHFICDSHGLQSWAIHSVMAASKKYKRDKDVKWIIENVFNPTTFYMLGDIDTISRNDEYVFSQLNEAFEKNLIWTNRSVDFQDFVDQFILTVHDQSFIESFSAFVKKELDLNQSTETRTYGDFLGPGYKGKYVKRRFKIADTWNTVNIFLNSLLVQHEYQDIVEILRCLIDKCKGDIYSQTVDVAEINDTSTKPSSILASREHSSRIIDYYELLCVSYVMLNQFDLIQEVIEEYQDAVEKNPSRCRFKTLAKLWRKLGGSEKAKEIENKLQDIEEEHSFSGQFLYSFQDILNM